MSDMNKKDIQYIITNMNEFLKIHEQKMSLTWSSEVLRTKQDCSTQRDGLSSFGRHNE